MKGNRLMTGHPQAWSGCCLIIWWYFGCSIEHPGHCLSPNPKLSLLVSRIHIIKEVPWTWHHQPIESTFMILQIFPSLHPFPKLCLSSRGTHSYCEDATLLGSFYVSILCLKFSCPMEIFFQSFTML